MRDFVYAFLSRDWAGLAIAGAVLLASGALLETLAPQSETLRHALVALVGLIGALLALGALRHLRTLAQTRKAHPPPGRLIDLGGYRVHLLAEGQARDGRPAIIWFAGGHASGAAIHHLHRTFRAETRSILIDRPGTGWSDTGPFPRTTAREADEIVLALERAGERGPFVFAGHSFGGLLCANVARRRPDLVHTLVLLDPTPLETLIFGPRFGAIREMQRAALVSGLAQLFGINLAERFRRQQAANPAYTKVFEVTERVLGPEVAALRGIDARPGTHFAMASIFRELSPEGAAACAWDTGVYDGDLGELPLLLVAPMNDVDTDALPEANTGDAEVSRRVVRRLARSRERYLATSTRAQRVVAPAGTGHNFVYEVPDWVAGVMRGVLHRQDRNPSTTP